MHLDTAPRGLEVGREHDYSVLKQLVGDLRILHLGGCLRFGGWGFLTWPCVWPEIWLGEGTSERLGRATESTVCVAAPLWCLGPGRFIREGGLPSSSAGGTCSKVCTPDIGGATVTIAFNKIPLGVQAPVIPVMVCILRSATTRRSASQKSDPTNRGMGGSAGRLQRRIVFQ